MNLDPQLRKICLNMGPALVGLSHEGKAVNGAALLMAITGLESSFGQRRLFVKMEPGYAPGGHYYKKSQEVRGLWYTYGCLAASSYGSFQIMFVTARELGFTGHPIDLQKDENCAYWASVLIRRRIMGSQGASTLTQVLDAYNSGNSRDRIVPADYIAKGHRLYSEALQTL